MEDLMSSKFEDEKVLLPGAVIFSLQSVRKELMALAIRQVVNGEIECNKDLVINLMKAMALLIGKVHIDGLKLQRIEEKFECLKEHMETIVEESKSSMEEIEEL